MTKRYMKAFGLVLVLLIFDQLTKYLAVLFLKEQNPIRILGDSFQLHYLENRGAAFGMLQNKMMFFYLITVIVVVGIAVLYQKVPNSRRFLILRLCMIFITAGALGNMIDRVFRKYVVDFFYFKLIHFPIFNVADIYVTVSVTVLAILLIFVYKDEELTFLTFKNKKAKEL